MADFVRTIFGSRLKEEELYRSIEALDADIQHIFARSMINVSNGGHEAYMSDWADKIHMALMPALTKLLKEASAEWNRAYEGEEGLRDAS